MAGTSIYLDDETAVLAEILQEYHQERMGGVGHISRSSVVRAALWDEIRSLGLDEDEVRAEIQRRMQAGP